MSDLPPSLQALDATWKQRRAAQQREATERQARIDALRAEADARQVEREREAAQAETERVNAFRQQMSARLDAERDRARVTFLNAGGTEQEFTVYWAQQRAARLKAATEQAESEQELLVRGWM